MQTLSNFIIKQRNYILIFWFISIMIAAVYAFAGHELKPEELMEGATHTEAYKVGKILENHYGFNNNLTAAIAIKDQVPVQDLIDLFIKKFPLIKSLSKVNSQYPHQTQLLFIKFKDEATIGSSQGLVPALRKELKDWEKKHNTRAYLTGHAGFFKDMKEAGKKESSKNELIALVMAFFILIFNFGSLVAAFLPILMGATSLVYLHAFSKLFQFEVEPIAQAMTSMVGLALAIDYSLFMVSRFKEEIEFKDEMQSLQISLKYAGHTILYSALIMLCSISVLFIPDLSAAHNVAQGLVLVIILSLISALCYLPAFLLLGKHVLDRPRTLSQWIEKSDKYGFWKRFSSHVVQYPKAYLVLSLSIFFLLLSPLKNLELWEPIQTLAPSYTESMQGYHLLEKDKWGGELMPISIIIKSPSDHSLLSKQSINYQYQLTQHLKTYPQIGEIQSITSWNSKYSAKEYVNFFDTIRRFRFMLPADNPLNFLMKETADENYLLIRVFVKDLMNVRETHKIVEQIRAFVDEQQSFEVLVGGTVARARDYTVTIYSEVPLMLSMILIGIFIILFYYMRAILLPFKAAFMNFLPILGAFGLLVIIFQYGYFQNLLNTPHNGAVSAMVPLVLFCVIFGLSMDYEVLILSRITEAYQGGMSVKDAVVEGLARSGSVITGAALILLGVFIPGIFSGSPVIKEISIGISAAILLDATILRLLLVPTFMLLMGKWNWWNPFSQKK